MKKIPNVIPATPKVNGVGVVAHQPAQAFLKWAWLALEAIHDRAPLIEAGARRDVYGVRGIAYDGPKSGRSYAPDGSCPGPTPGAAAASDVAADLMEQYAEGFRLLRHAISKLGSVSDRFTPLSQEEAKALKRSQDGGADCAKCERWVAQTPSDRLRGGLCFSCYRKSPNPEPE